METWINSLAIVVVGVVLGWFLNRISTRQDQLVESVNKGLISNERLEVWKDEHDKKDNSRHEEMMKSIQVLGHSTTGSMDYHVKFFHSKGREGDI